MVDKSFKVICDLIERQSVTYDEAYELMKDYFRKSDDETWAERLIHEVNDNGQIWHIDDNWITVSSTGTIALSKGKD